MKKTMQREDMGKDSYEEAIAELEKLIRFSFVETWNTFNSGIALIIWWIICSDKGAQALVVASKVDQIKAELQTDNGSAVLSPTVERLKTGFLTFKETKYK